jgi:RNA polymerase sigma factor (sigma-70 family)
MSHQQETKQQHAFDRAYCDYKKGLDRHSLFKINNVAISENLVQETFLKTWKYIVLGGKIEVMKAFLYHVLNGLIIDEYRKRKTTSLDSLVEKGFEPKGDDSESIINILDSKRATLMIALLPLKYQCVMRMKYMQNLSLGEMSLATGQSNNTIAVQLSRGLGILKKMYPLSI